MDANKKKWLIRAIQITLAIFAVGCLVGALCFRAAKNSDVEKYDKTIEEYTIQNKEEYPEDPFPSPTEPEEDVEPEATPTPEPPTPYESGADFEGLTSVNSEVVGWVSIPGTSVNFPFVQGEDNTKYLSLDWDETSNTAGAAFLDCRADLTDASKYVIYGHAMPNTGLMFSSVLNYQDKSYYEAHPSIYLSFASDPIGRRQTGSDGLLQPEGQYEFQIISVNKVDSTEEEVIGDFYWTKETDRSELVNFAPMVRDTSLYDIPFKGTPYKYVMLSTCAHPGYSSDEKVLVIGVLTEESLEDEPADTTAEATPAPEEGGD